MLTAMYGDGYHHGTVGLAFSERFVLASLPRRDASRFPSPHTFFHLMPSRV